MFFAASLLRGRFARPSSRIQARLRAPAFALATLALALAPGRIAAQPSAPEPTAGPAGAGSDSAAAQPFGANLFGGHYAAQREDGLNPSYQILPGDRVMVNAWGAVTINDVFVVDTQGNIFLPGIGPVHLAGVQNQQLTGIVRRQIATVYRRNFEVYTNLLTASPIAIFVTGAVARPGRYAGIPSDSVLIYLDQAGGIDPHRGSYRQVSVMREGQAIAELDLYDFLLRGTLPTPQFADGDTILVHRRGPTVQVLGASPEPVLVELIGEAHTGADILGVLRSSSRANEITLEGLREGAPVVHTLPVAEFAGASLLDGDVITFREEGRAGQILIRLEGEFQGPSVLSVRRGARLLDVLNHVPVDPEISNVRGVHVRRARVAAQQARSIQESLDRLERNALLAVSATTGEAEIRVREAELVRHFVSRARAVTPLGRVVTVSAGSQLNVLLQDGDVIVIPERTNVVRVVGEVQIAQAVMYRPNLRVRDYVEMAGGYTSRAEVGAVIVIRPNAEVALGGGDLRIGPGDEVMIPPRIDDKVFQNVTDLSRVIYQIAIATSLLVGL